MCSRRYELNLNSAQKRDHTLLHNVFTRVYAGRSLIDEMAQHCLQSV